MKTHRLLLGLLLLTTLTAKAQFNFVTNDGIAIINGYTGGGGAVTIPATLGGLPVTVIEGSGFEDRGITSVAIPDTVTNIGTQEFAPNEQLTSFSVDSNNPVYSSAGGVLFDKSGKTLVEYPPGLSGNYAIPASVTTIGESAFSACYFVSTVTFPVGLTNIGPQAFAFCFALTNVTIPANVSVIGPDVFMNCTNLPAIDVDSGNPYFASVGGVLFDKNETTLLDFPTGLRGSYAVPSGVTTLGTSCFVLCAALTNITIPTSVTTIENSAFGDCTGLNSLTLGAGVSFIDTTAFGGCANLTAINVDPANADFSSFNGVVYNKQQTILEQFPPGFTGGYTIPNTVTSVADDAAEGCKLTDLIVPGSVTSIGEVSFQGCGNLTNVTMSNGVSSIGVFAFADSPKLATVTIPATVTSLPFGAFAYDGLTSVTFEGNAPVTDPNAFLGESATIYYMAGTSGWSNPFDGLTTQIEGAPSPNGALQVAILPAAAALAGAQWQVDSGVLQPSGAIVLGLSAGQHTVSFSALNGWTPPGAQIVSVGANATNTASGTYTEAASPATDFVYTTNAGGIEITGYVGPGGSVNIPAVITGLPVRGIGDSVFANNNSVTSLAMPDSVTNLGNYIFSGTEELQSVTVSAGVHQIGIGEFEDCFALSSITFRGALTSIGDGALASCPLLVDFTIPDTLTNLGNNALFGDGLTNAFIPAGLTHIGVSAFMDCNQLPAIDVDPANPAYASSGGVLFNKNLTELVEFPGGYPATTYVISNGVTSIGDAAFEDCNLTSITIPATVTNIGNYSFENCALLAGVTIPQGVVSIGNEAFAMDNNLTTIALPASVTSLGQVPFANCGSMTAITAASGNPAFSDVGGVLYDKAGQTLIEYPSGVPGSFAIPGGVMNIGTEAFEQTKLTGVAIPGSVTNIGLSAFFNCVDLLNVSMAAGLKNIGVGAFESCYALTNMTLPGSVTNIGFAAFNSCSALTRVVIPSAVTNVGDYAFASCSGLAAVYFEGNAPPDDGTVFSGDGSVTVYYLPGATGWGATFGGETTAELAGIAVTAHPASGKVPLTVSFTAAGVDSAANPVVNWNWNFGDGATSAVQNPSHTYLSPGAFAASVVETNSQGLPLAGGVISITAAPVPVYSGLVANGGFETGDFSWWTLSGEDPSANFVTSAQSAVLPHSGNYFAVLGSAGGLGYLSQTLTTIAAGQYALSLWLNSPDGLGPNELSVSWNGTTLFDETNISAIGWTNLQFIVSAAETNSVLELGFRDDPSFLGLDDISAYPTLPNIGAASVAGANLLLDGINGQSGDTYFVLASTNLALPLNQWTRVATNLLTANGNFTITVTNTVSATIPKRFYLLQTQ